MKHPGIYCVLLPVLLGIAACSPKNSEDASRFRNWSSYLGGPDRNHFSALGQITPENVRNLTVAWRYAAPDYGQMQMNPIVVDSVLFGVTAAMRLVALHAGTGRELWRFGDSLKVWHSTSRGVAYWQKGDDARIFYSRGHELYALDARTGIPVKSFGLGGRIDMRSRLTKGGEEVFVISNTPGTIFGNLIIMPIRVSEGVGAAPGHIMAFNTIDGHLEWVFHTIPRPGEVGAESWEDREAYRKGIVGGANNWAGMALDESTGMLYVPTGSASPDFYGGVRKGSNLFANCLLALDAATGELRWHYQFTHHDLWDRDLPAPPNLITVKRNGKPVDAVAQVTKQGYVYLFDRKDGTPLFEIEELPVPASRLKGESAWPTQPFPVLPPPYARQSAGLTESDISPYAPDRDSLLAVFRAADKRTYAPPGLSPVFLLPGYDGGAEWGGAAADPANGILYVNANEMAWIMEMEEAKATTERLPLGEALYTRYCAACHLKDRQGIPESGYPSLLDLTERMGTEEIADIITKGRGLMSGFPQLTGEEKQSLISFLSGQDDWREVVAEPAADTGYFLPYRHKGYNKFLDSNGFPGISPPWGTLHAIDMNSGAYLWSVTLGDFRGLRQPGDAPTGTENYGGAVVTENGLLFIAATKDGYFRAFNRHTGELLWEYELPAPAFATPAMYELNGIQYIALACGGEKLGTEPGNQIIAFALKKSHK